MKLPRISSLFRPAALRQSARGVGPIGLDLAASSLQLVQLERTPAGLRIRAAASRRYPGAREALLEAPAELKRLVSEALRSAPFRGRRTVTAMPSDRVKLMVLSYERKAATSEPEQILSLVAERTRDPLESCVIDYLPIRPDHERKDEGSALVAIAREEAVIGYLELLRGAGLEVESLEIGPVAVRRLVTYLTNEGPRPNVLVLDVHQSRTHLTVLWGRRLILYREIDFGELRALEALRRSMELEPKAAAELLERYGVSAATSGGGSSRGMVSSSDVADTLAEVLKPCFKVVAEQVSNALVYTASRTRGGSVDVVQLVGGLARWPGIDSLLSELLSMPVQIVDPFAEFPGAPDGASSGDYPTLATGLALRGMTSDE